MALIFVGIPQGLSPFPVRDDDRRLRAFRDKAASNLAEDHAGELVYLAPTRVNLQMTEERWPDIEFRATREQGGLAG